MYVCVFTYIYMCNYNAICETKMHDKANMKYLTQNKILQIISLIFCKVFMY